MNGHYNFDRADLGTIDGIGGILKSVGDFKGQLDEIDVRGHTSTPDFRIDVGGAAVPLETDFHAVVDGTNGDTYLKQVNAKLQDTPITASGAIESQKGVKGLDHQARRQDRGRTESRTCCGSRSRRRIR